MGYINQGKLDNTPFKPRVGVQGYPPEESILWIRPNRNLDEANIERYALTFDAYAFAGAVGIDLFEKSPLLETFLDFRCSLFMLQRRIRHNADWSGTDFFELYEMNQLICDAWDRERGTLDISPRYNAELRTAIAAAQVSGAFEASDVDVSTMLLSAYPAYGYLSVDIGLASKPQDGEDHLWAVHRKRVTAERSQGGTDGSVSITLLRNGLPVLGVVLASPVSGNCGDLLFWAEGMQSAHCNNDPVSYNGSGESVMDSSAIISRRAADATKIKGSTKQS